MIGYLWRTSKGYRLRPWASPYLRWRIETYWGLDADHITLKQFLSFMWTHRSEMARFLKWAARMDAVSRGRGGARFGSKMQGPGKIRVAPDAADL